MKVPPVTKTLAALGLVVLAGCEEKKPPLPPEPPASASASAAPAPVPGSLALVIDPSSSASIDMPAPKEHIVAKVSGGAGKLALVPSDLRRSRGEVKLDLRTLATRTFGDRRDEEQTAHARTWLEVADGTKGKIPDDVKERNRWAVYTIRAIDGASATELAKVPAEKDPSGADIRRVTLTTKGDLLIHGRKAERDVHVEITFRYAPDAPADKPEAATITTKKPLTVVLAEHDVKPRNAAAELAKDFFHLLGTKVADTADVTLELRAKTEP